MSATVLLIGGTRFLGRAIAEPFIAKGYRVYELNRGTRPPTPGIVEPMVCDKADRTAFGAALKSRTWDFVIDTILNDEDLTFVVETLGSQVGHFLHTGSLGVYGEARRIPAVESQPLAVVEEGEMKSGTVLFNYKIRQDQVLLRAFQERAFPATILRMSYIYGPGDLLLDGWGGRSAEFFRMMRDGETILLPNDGQALLHPGHVKDLGRIFLHAAEHPESIGQVYNAAGDHALMMKDYVSLIAREMGVEPRFEFLPVPEVLARFPKHTHERGMRFACQHMCASIVKAERDLGWRPEIPLAAGVRETLEWMRNKALI